MVNFGENLKKMRKASKMTQQMLADKVGVTKSIISYYELQARNPSPEMLIKLAGVFGVSTDHMLGLEKIPSVTLDVSGLDNEDLMLVRELVHRLKKKNTK